MTSEPDRASYNDNAFIVVPLSQLQITSIQLLREVFRFTIVCNLGPIFVRLIPINGGCVSLMHFLFTFIVSPILLPLQRLYGQMIPEKWHMGTTCAIW